MNSENSTKLRNLIENNSFLPIPSCFDALSAKLIEQTGFDAMFMSGFAASASRIGEPDLGVMTLTEVLDQLNNITDATSLPVIGDGDTGYGNAMNVQRTVKSFAKIGCAGVLIEDQLSPKRCGHTPGKDVVSREEAFDRIRASVDAREEKDILIMARTDANHTHGIKEAIERAQIFHELGSDILFVEAPKTEDEMKLICQEVPGCKIANIVEGGLTPNLSMKELEDIGYNMAVYPLTVLSSAMKAMVESLNKLKKDDDRSSNLMSFTELRKRVGFDDYYETSSRYKSSKR
ncbi:isocitrate lyase/PEP mutase family protein [Alphaproteobacteria bacterium]|nr:isocitrate lyase/PEP mutase family protein [Alphaproteobacteria bacterium]